MTTQNSDARVDIGSEAPKSFVDCISWAKSLFNEMFHDSIIHLLKCFPPDCKDEEGEPFWGGSSTRFLPMPISLDSGFIVSVVFFPPNVVLLFIRVGSYFLATLTMLLLPLNHKIRRCNTP